jgi:hypothetical protein
MYTPEVAIPFLMLQFPFVYCLALFGNFFSFRTIININIDGGLHIGKANFFKSWLAGPWTKKTCQKRVPFLMDAILCRKSLQ